MDRVEFLKARIQALEASIKHHHEVLDLIDAVGAASEEEQRSDEVEMKRRIKIDRDLHAKRVDELKLSLKER